MKRFKLLLLVASTACSQSTNLHSQILQKPLLTSNSGLTCRRLPQLMSYIVSKHVTEKEINNDIKNRIKEQYIKWLDGNKTLFLKSDVTSIQNEIEKMFKSMNTGDCSALDKINQIALRRAKENEDFITKLMGKNYKLNESVEFVSDSKKRDYFKNDKDKFAFLEKLAHFQFANYLLADTKEDEAKELLPKRYTRFTKRIEEKNHETLIADFIKAFASSLDPHSSYFSPADYEDFNVDMNLQLEGIGASLSSQDGYTVVEELIKGGAAEKANELQPKDKIIAVAQDREEPVNVIDMDLKDVVRLIRGKKGTRVHLTVLRSTGGETSRLIIPIVRDKVDLTDQAAKITYEKRKINGKETVLAIIDFPSFYGSADDSDLRTRSSYRDIRNLIIEANKNKAGGILINLAQNGGGVLDGARKISGLFIEEGAIVATQDYRQRIEFLIDNDKEVLYSGPLVLLTSRLSASAAEIMAGALKDYRRALVVGADHTFGKGTVQQVEPLPYELGAVKTTTAKFFIPSGATTQHQGVSSHIVFPSIFHSDDIGEKSFDYSLKPSKIQPFLSDKVNTKKTWTALSDDLIKKLQKRSEERIAKSEDFKKIKEDIAESQKNEETIKLAEFMSKARTKKTEEDSKKEKSPKERREELHRPYINEGLNVLEDLIVELAAKSS
jgi:carboxyl-terminal processing protease